MPPDPSARPVTIVCCRTGIQKHAPELLGAAIGGNPVALTDCFDRCDACEIRLLAKLDGTLMRFDSSAALEEAVRALAEP